MYDDVVFIGRYRYPLTMFGHPVLTGLSLLLKVTIAYEIDTTEIIAAFCRICYCLHDLMRLKMDIWIGVDNGKKLRIAGNLRLI